MKSVDLETQPVGKLLLHYSIPAIIGTLSTSLYNLTDRAFIGQGVGPYAISGLALTFPIMILIQAFGTLVGVGAAARISIVLGMKDTPWAERILANSLFLTLTFWAITTVFGLTFLDNLLMIFGGSENTIPYAREFMQIVIPASVLSNISYGYGSMMRASGYPKKSMYASLIGVGLNLILAPIFIFVLKLGIQGAAIATTISMFVSASYVIHHFLSKSSRVRFRRHAFKLKWFIIRNITAIGLSPFLMNIAASAVVMVANLVLRKYGGDLAIGAYAIMGGYAMVFVMITLGVCQGMQPIVGYSYGARKLKRMKDTLLLAVKVGMAVNSVGLICALLIPTPMARLFTTDAELIELISHGLIFVFIMAPLIGFQTVTSVFYQSINKPFLSITMSLCRQVLFFVPCMLIFSRFWGVHGVWYALTTADFLSVVVAVIVLLWQRRVFYPRLAR
ncbi:MAG: MATE family efflux transporter [Bacteroidales bacterium]|jgi:putative MATE family efflux protein|nr:MATE family efflux transporter [Bacteroidales bacterium]